MIAASTVDSETNGQPQAPPADASVEQALAADIQLLDDLLADVIRRLAGAEAFSLVDRVRAAAQELRAEPSVEKARALRDQLDGLELPALRTLTRAFSIYFDLVNLAEQQARVRANRRRAQQRAPLPLEESPEAALVQLRERGVGVESIAALLERALVCPVLTAHPSEARRRTILEKLVAIARQLDVLEYSRLMPRERERAVAAIAEELEAFWLSDTVRVARPTVLDEVRQAGEVVESSLFDVVPRVYRDFESALARVYPEYQGRVPAFLKFGSWIGGDRDGNPNVDHTVTAEAVRLQQETLLQHYLKHVDALGRQLSHSEHFIAASPEFRASIERDGDLFPKLAARREHEPYRSKCRYIAARLRRTLQFVRSVQPRWADEGAGLPEGVYTSHHELKADLEAIAADLERIGARASAAGSVRDLIRLVEVFGVHLLTLDVRQHSQRHEQAVDEILAWAGVCPRYGKLSAVDRFECLAQQLAQPRPVVPAHLPFAPETREVVQTFRTLSALLEQQSPEAINTYIVSGCTEPAHLLEVLLLARDARLFRPEDGVSRINIVPLFEALAPLQNAATIVNRLLLLPVYRKHLELRGNVQEVMIGYSDSNKETGFLQSAWALNRAQRALGETGRRTGVTVQIFHGRGGAIGRGGGPANRAILAQPRDTVDGRLRITEQGEMIADRYGHQAIAERHLEQVINAMLRSSFALDSDRPEPGWERLLERLAEKACRSYHSLLYGNPDFIAYFEQATPIAEISQLKIASRPARRSPGSQGIEQLRAIPWVFSWMQSRHTLPGWYGLGSAVTEYLAEHDDELPTLQAMYRHWPFWRTIVDNAQMILAKADLVIARLYADLVEDQELAARIFGHIEAEYARTVAVIRLITGQSALLDNVPVLQRSIERRNPFVDPLSFIQLVILKRLRAAADPPPELLTAVLESINGIAAGLKNTG